VSKKIKIRLRAEVVRNPETGNYKLEFKNPDLYQYEVQKLKYDKYVMVDIENQRTQRTLPQNSYWHGVCFPGIAELTGYTMLEAKEVCKQKFIEPKILLVMGEEIITRRGSSELGKGEGVEFTDNMRQLAVDLGGYIPTPCEVGYYCYKKECGTCVVIMRELRELST